MIVLLLVGAVVASAAGGAIMFSATYGHVTPGWNQGGALEFSSPAPPWVPRPSCSNWCPARSSPLLSSGRARPASMRDVLRVAWSRRRQLLAWAQYQPWLVC